MYLSGVLLLLLPLNFFCFNIDTSHFIVYVDPQKIGNTSTNYFGYTVVVYPGDKKQRSGKWIKIGAPKGQDPKIKSKRTGVVYDCPFMEKCKPVNIKMGTSKSEERLEGAWIGGSMDINYKFNKLTICGYRTVYEREGHYDQIGSCYLSNILKNRFEEIVPLKDSEKRFDNKYNPTTYNYGLGEAGFSVHIPKNEDAVLLGAPGVYNWVGTMVKAVDETIRDPIASRLRTRSLVMPRTTVAAPGEYSISTGFQLFGYSITSGYFFNKKLYYAGSAPKYGRYKGKVAVFEFDNDRPVKEKLAVVGNQFGEYFGAATTAGDLNGDTFDDLIVGAPYYAETTYNEGAVYIFLGSVYQLKKHQTLYGRKTNGQFGSAVMFLGDINDDDFGDLAIGAPYEEEFSGALYIYKGNKEGIDMQPCQRIIGKHILPEIQGFGISISRTADIDENGYKDLVVGAYLSGHAVLLRTRPVVVISYEMKSIPKELLQDTRQFLVNICYKYTHFKNDTLGLERTIVIDELLSRAYLKNSVEGTKLITIRKQAPFTCENVTVVLGNTKNFVAPITISLNYKLRGQQKEKQVVYVSEKYQNGTDTFCVRCPVLDEFRSSQPSSIAVPFGLGCGPDNLCQSELTIDAKFLDLQDNTFVVGSSNYLNLQTIIKNSGENAYSTQLEVTLPDIINLRQIPPECYEQNISVIICDVENPLKKDREKKQVLNLDMKKINKNNRKTEVSIGVRVITISNNNNINYINLTLVLRREADIVITGKSGEQSVPFTDLSSEMQNFTQIYQVDKVGASPLEKVQVNITIPHSIKTSSNDISFIKVFTPEATFAGQPMMCTSNLNFVIESTPAEKSEKLLSEEMHQRRRRQVEVFNKTQGEKKEDIIIGEKEYDLAPNRTRFLNCSTEQIICSNIVCTLGPFEKGQAPAVIKIKMMFDPCIISQLSEEKTLILFTTTGTTTIEIPPQFNQSGNRPDFVEVSSLFINESKRKKKVALWIIILALIAGILLLALIVYGLTKLGFFKRTKKEELKNLKAATQQMIEAEGNPNATNAVMNDSEELDEHPNAESSNTGLARDDPTMNASTEGLVDQKEDNVFE